MARFYRIQLDSIYLTSDGTVSGVPCKLEIPEVSDVIDGFAQNPVIANNGEVVHQTFEQINGKIFNIAVEVMTKTLWESLKTLRDTALGSSLTINVIGTGDIGDFDIEAIPLKFLSNQFITDRIKDVTLSFISVSQN